MKLNVKVVAKVESELAAVLGDHVHVRDAIPLSGGSINEAWQLETTRGRFFLKTNTADRHPSRFVAEALDLDLIAQAKALPTPKVLAQGEADGTAFLLLEFITATSWTSEADAALGRGLARLHRRTQAQFGLDRNNWIGLLPQVNTPNSDWPAFLVEHRLDPLVRMARDHGKLGGGDVLRFERLYARLPQLLPKEVPALLHGDLWHGNVLNASNGVVVLDPAAYFGHREMDIAMAGLFGGIGPGFFQAYTGQFPLETGWEDRVGLCRLYPLLVHVNLFGGSYAAQINGTLQRYV